MIKVIQITDRAKFVLEATRWIFISNAVINWLVSPTGIINPSFSTMQVFGGAEPIYPSIIRLWLGLVFMFGCMFWEVSRDVRGKAALIKYNWIEKTITASAITLGYHLGDIPARLMTLVIFTNWIWIPVILWADLSVQRVLKTMTRHEA